jgi:hypothetical protein
MKVGFFTVFRQDPQHYVHAELLTRSVRAAMPGIEVVQLTDETSPPVLGVDAVLRKPNGPMLERRLEHYASLDGPWLLLDTDVLVQTDVRAIFNHNFDVAMADRNWPHIPPTPELTAEMPFNTGVVFSRSKAFWAEALNVWRGFTEEQRRDWLSEQRAVAKTVASALFRIGVLPGMTFNYPPVSATDPGMEGAAILHFKGPRKPWMAEVFKKASTKTAVVPAPGPRRIESQPATVKAIAIRTPLKVFIGYDPRQPVAFHVAAHSVQTRAKVPVSVTRLQLDQLPVARRGLTEFTFSRFLVPYLSHFEGMSVFLDADTLCLGDIGELVAHCVREPEAADVYVSKNPRRFEWASVMVFNNERCQHLTPEFVGDVANGLLDLKWASRIGDFPATWNHLVGYDPTPAETPKLLHYTKGVPCWPDTIPEGYVDEWVREREALLHTVSFDELMGHSVHVKHLAGAR